MRTSGKTNNAPGWPVYIRQAQGQRIIKIGAKALFSPFALSLPRAMGPSSLRVFGSTCPHTSKMDFPAII